MYVKKIQEKNIEEIDIAVAKFILFMLEIVIEFALFQNYFNI